ASGYPAGSVPAGSEKPAGSTEPAGSIHAACTSVSADSIPVYAEATTLPPEPTSIAKALEDPDWVATMQEEMQQFINQKALKILTFQSMCTGLLKPCMDFIKHPEPEFEVLMKGEFEMSALGEMTFFLGLQ
nr:hypothetical protein [Tanacetum cinerariifolium]